MWQQFSEQAEQAVLGAQDEAHRLGSAYVSTEHLLLGLLSQEDSNAFHMILALGIDPQNIRDRIEEAAGGGEPVAPRELSLTPRATGVLEYAFEESEGLTQPYIGTEHILIGLLREEAGFAARVLGRTGIHLDDVRQLATTMPSLEAPPEASYEPLDDDYAANATELLLELILGDMPPGLTLVLEQRGINPWAIDSLLEANDPFDSQVTFAELLVDAQGIAADRKDAVLTGDHFVLAILLRGQSLAAYILESLGLTYDVIEAAMDQ
ncbi:MAG: hypothetical protein IT363_03600 [Methanoregulaceae archaeon]|nr:hypothetical protein [Methanoregulaceae archaeon]